MTAPLPELERHGSPTAGRAVLMIPGYGDGPDVFARQLDRLDPDRRWYVVIPRPISDGPAGPMWYSGRDGQLDLAAIGRAAATIDATLDQLASEAGVPRHEIVVLGHSQGGALGLATALDPDSGARPRAVGVLAGYLPNLDEGRIDLTRAEDLEALFVHSPDDPMIDVVRGRGAAKAVERAGAQVRFVEVEGKHRLGPELVEPAVTWLADLAT